MKALCHGQTPAMAGASSLSILTGVATAERSLAMLAMMIQGLGFARLRSAHWCLRGHMRYLALATDYDGTLATHGEVDRATQLALERFVASGRKLIMVTGRQVEDLPSVFPRLDLFERVVAENGAVVYTSSTQELRLLEEPPA